MSLSNVKFAKVRIRWNILFLFLMAYGAAFLVDDKDLTGDLVMIITTAAITMAKEIFQADDGANDDDSDKGDSQ